MKSHTKPKLSKEQIHLAGQWKKVQDTLKDIGQTVFNPNH